MNGLVNIAMRLFMRFGMRRVMSLMSKGQKVDPNAKAAQQRMRSIKRMGRF